MIYHEEFNNIHIKIFEAPTTEQILIAVHGFAGDCESSVITAVADALIEKNITTITFDLPCHGESKIDGVLKLSMCREHLDNVESYAKNQFKNKPISYFATSFGGYLLLNKLSGSNAKYNKVILRAPAIFMSDILSQNLMNEHNFKMDEFKSNILNFGYGRELLVDYKFYEDLKHFNLQNYNNNNHLYVLQGKKDDIVDYERNAVWLKTFAQNNHTLFYFENADHRFKNPGELEEIVNITKHIFS